MSLASTPTRRVAFTGTDGKRCVGVGAGFNNRIRVFSVFERLA